MAKRTKKTQEAIEEENGNTNPEAENMNNEAMEQQAQEAQEQVEEQAAPENETPEQKSARLVREEQLKEAKTYIGHKAMYVPAEDYEFHPATVVGAVLDPKGTVLVALRTEEGKRVTKKFGSKLLRVLEEMADKPVRSRAKKEKTPITEETIQLHRDQIGLPCVLDGMEGRVRGIQHDKRTCQIYLTIHLLDGTKRHTKIDNANLTIGEADEETETIRERYNAVLAQRANGGKALPENQVQAHGAGFINAYKALIEAGRIEETENLIACIEDVMATAKQLKQSSDGEQEEEQPTEEAAE